MNDSVEMTPSCIFAVEVAKQLKDYPVYWKATEGQWPNFSSLSPSLSHKHTHIFSIT